MKSPLMQPEEGMGPDESAQHEGGEAPGYEQEEKTEGDMEDSEAEDMGEEVAPDANDPARVTYETIVAGLTEFMFGKGKDGIVKQLQSAGKDLTVKMGQITFTLLKQAVEQSKQTQVEIDMEMMMAVATEVIDSLIRMVRALKIKAPADGLMREQALMVATQSYLATTQPGSEEQAAAQQALQQMDADGTMAAGAKTLGGIGKRAGVDPYATAGQAAVAGAADAEQAPPEQGSPLMQGA
jgi:hypothetical protein